MRRYLFLALLLLALLFASAGLVRPSQDDRCTVKDQTRTLSIDTERGWKLVLASKCRTVHFELQRMLEPKLAETFASWERDFWQATRMRLTTLHSYTLSLSNTGTEDVILGIMSTDFALSGFTGASHDLRIEVAGCSTLTLSYVSPWPPVIMHQPFITATQVGPGMSMKIHNVGSVGIVMSKESQHALATQSTSHMETSSLEASPCG